MRKFTLLLLSIALVATACKTSTEDKLKEAIKGYELSQLGKGEKVESFKIDSIDYYLGSMKDIFVNENLKYHDLFKDEDDLYLGYSMSKIDEFQPIIDSIRIADTLDQTAATYKFARTTNDKVISDHWKIKDLKADLENAEERADTVKKYYIVNYQFSLKSNENSDSRHNTIFVNASDFKIKVSPVDWSNRKLIFNN